MITMQVSIRLVQIIIALAVLIQTSEYLLLKESFGANGVWRWKEIKTELNFLPKKIQDLFNFILQDKHFLILLWARLISSIIFLITPTFFLISILLLSSFFIAQRFRGSFNGGSDYMSLIILGSLVVQSLSSNPVITKGVLWYIALQSCTSYFIAGLVKIKQQNWRRGYALVNFLQSPNYRTPKLVRSLSSHKIIALSASWIVILFELSFPLIFIQHNHAVVELWLFTAFTFHLINVYLFGLNRFLIVWSATYPAIYFCILG